MASIRTDPAKYVNRAILNGACLGLTLGAIFFFIFSLLDVSKFALLFFIPIILFFSIAFTLKVPQVRIVQRQRLLDREVVYIGRFLLIKIESGVPFYNAMIDISKSNSPISMFFKEIVTRIETGTPIENALEESIEYCPSDKLRRILFQLSNALKTGIDIGSSLRKILDQITKEQVIEIKEYGKKLNSIALLYMLIGVVVPALGTTMAIVLTSFVSIKLGWGSLIIVLFFVFIFQFIFLSIFRSSRPMVNL